MGSMTQHFIKDQANEGKRIDLYTIDGEKTEDYLVLCSVHSDLFVNAKEQYMKEVAAHAAGDGEKPTPLKVVASAIKEWSFDEELTPESALTFLQNAPHIAEKIDKLISDVTFFYAKK